MDSLVGEPVFLALGREMPAFGGFFFNEDHEIVIYVTDPGATVQTRGAIRAVLQGRAHTEDLRPYTAREMIFREADYAFLQLAEYRTKLRGMVFAIPGVVSLGVRESKNRVEIGVAEMGIVSEVKALLKALQIPEQAVIFSRRNYAVPHSHTLDNPHPDGVIQGALNANGCTIGFPAIRNGTEGFITASHCTQVTYGQDDTPFYQPTSPHFIGTELYDPAYWYCTYDGHYYPCRYSDAAFIQAAAPLDFAKIARTIDRVGDQSTGPLEIDHNNPTLTIVSKGGNVAEGEIVDKIGNTSGWTSGPVLDTCTDMLGEDGFIRVCSDKIDMFSHDGDSGSPVFVRLGNGRVSLRGVGWGGEQEVFGPPTDTDIVISDMNQIEKDFGLLIVSLVAIINGPFQVERNTIETWTSTIRGGTPPYSYEWSRDFPDGARLVVSTNDSYTAGTGDGYDFSLMLHVTDAKGLTDTTFFHVIVGEPGDESCSSSANNTMANIPPPC